MGDGDFKKSKGGLVCESNESREAACGQIKSESEEMGKGK